MIRIYNRHLLLALVVILILTSIAGYVLDYAFVICNLLLLLCPCISDSVSLSIMEGEGLNMRAAHQSICHTKESINTWSYRISPVSSYDDR